jgi:putative sterol carrier protein
VPLFGTIEVYDALAERLNDDEEWAVLGKPITNTMVHVYREPIDKSFFVRFEEGRITDVRELSSPDAEEVDFVLTADPDVWRSIIEKKTKPTVAMTTGKVKIKGNMGALMKHMKPFSHVMDVMTEIDLV